MPKMKTNRAAAKRFKVTGTGKFKRRKANLRHLLEGRPKSVKARAGQSVIVHKADEGHLKRLLPYS